MLPTHTVLALPCCQPIPDWPYHAVNPYRADCDMYHAINLYGTDPTMPYHTMPPPLAVLASSTANALTRYHTYTRHATVPDVLHHADMEHIWVLRDRLRCPGLGTEPVCSTEQAQTTGARRLETTPRASPNHRCRWVRDHAQSKTTGARELETTPRARPNHRRTCVTKAAENTVDTRTGRDAVCDYQQGLVLCRCALSVCIINLHHQFA